MKKEFIALTVLLAICGVCAADFTYADSETSVNSQGSSIIGSEGSGSSAGKTTTSSWSTIETSRSTATANTIARSTKPYGRATGGSSVSTGSQTSNTGTTASAETSVDVTGPGAAGQADGQANGQAYGDISATMVKPEIRKPVR